MDEFERVENINLLNDCCVTLQGVESGEKNSTTKISPTTDIIPSYPSKFCLTGMRGTEGTSIPKLVHGFDKNSIPYPNRLMPRLEEILMFPIVLSTMKNLLKKLWPLKDSGQYPWKYFEFYNHQGFLSSLPKKMAEWKTLGRRGITRHNGRH